MALIIRGLDLDASDNASTSDVSGLDHRLGTVEAWKNIAESDLRITKQLVQLYNTDDTETVLTIADALNALATAGDINITFVDSRSDENS